MATKVTKEVKIFTLEQAILRAELRKNVLEAELNLKKVQLECLKNEVSFR